MYLLSADMSNLIIVPQVTPAPSVTLNIETTSIILAALVSASILLSSVIRIINNFSMIDNSIKALKDGLNSNTKALEEFKLLSQQILSIDKKLDIHLQEYLNRKDIIQLMLVQLNEKIDLNKENNESALELLRAELKDLENFLQTQSAFKTRS